MDYVLSTLERLVALPSVSAEGRSLHETAQLVQELLADLGFHTELHTTPGAPVVFAQHIPPNPAKTLLMYNHYDVQPADPLELWDSEPFTLTRREGKLFARGADDDKGELVARLAALKWFKEEHGHIPFGVKFCIEGEEEIGSPWLESYVSEHLEQLKADAVLWESGGLDAAGRPTIYCGLKGIVALELRAKTAGYDLHSSYGAVIQNPMYRLACAVASLRDNQGRVQVKGFYDKVRPLTALEKEAIAAIPDESAQIAQVFGAGAMGGLSGAAFYQQLLAEPCININGIHGGYAGAGSKTVLPAEGYVKIDIRLVPDQEPGEIIALVQEHLQSQGFSDIELIKLEVGEGPARSDLSSSWVSMARTACREVYGTEAVVWPNMAGSGPMHPFTDLIGAPVVGLGIGYPGSKIHSPNEHVVIENLERGILLIKRLLEKFAQSALNSS
jgi:acetylornithine deacetylase/succinyl-diaminopimelate desuccinylase-like protein